MRAFTVSIDVPVEHMQNLFGEYDSHIKRIENDLNVIIVDRDGAVRISGEKEAADRAARIVNELLALSRRGNVLEEQSVDYAIELGRENKEDMLLAMDRSDAGRVALAPLHAIKKRNNINCLAFGHEPEARHIVGFLT